MTPFLLTDAAPNAANIATAKTSADVADNVAAFIDVFAVLTTSSEEGGMAPVPVLIAEDGEIPVETLAPEQQANADVSVVDPLPQTVEVDVMPLVAPLEPKQISMVAQSERAVDAVKSVKSEEPRIVAVSGDTPNRENSAVIGTTVARTPSMSQSIVESSLPIQDAKVAPTPPDLPKNTPIATPAALLTPVPQRTIAETPRRDIAPAAGYIDQGQQIVLDSDHDRQKRQAELPPAEIRRPEATIPVHGSAPASNVPQGGLVQLQTSDANRKIRVEVPTDTAVALSVNERQVVTHATATASPPTASAEMARHVANQMAVAVSNLQGRTTEIALSPKELGRVRLTMTAAEASITLTVFADRPETTDLMRRHIDTLAQEFKSLGYDDISFSFEDGRDTDSENTAENPTNQGDITAAEITEDTQPIQQLLARTGLDLRL